MKIALDPYMFRATPLIELPGLVAELGFEYIELSPRDDFLPFFLHPRADTSTIAGFRKALAGAGVELSSVLPLYRWSGPDEDERQAAVRYWKRAIAITAELGCTVMNSEFNGRPERASLSEAQFWKSLEGRASVRAGHSDFGTVGSRASVFDGSPAPVVLVAPGPRTAGGRR
jgi:myo-inositol catabolism protein IolH